MTKTICLALFTALLLTGCASRSNEAFQAWYNQATPAELQAYYERKLIHSQIQRNEAEAEALRMEPITRFFDRQAARRTVPVLPPAYQPLPLPPLNLGTHCTTQAFGNQLNTDCW